MAAMTSLGVHTPVALPYLVAEGLLPANPKPDLYQWETYVFDEGCGDVEEEVLATGRCVVWSQGKFIRNVYRFELEGEDVVQALLTHFPAPFQAPEAHFQERDLVNNGTSSGVQKNIYDRHDEVPNKTPPKAAGSGLALSTRAMVVFLKSKAHIYFLYGASHIVDLPFEVGKAFPAPRGVVVQRKQPHILSSPPPPPPNVPVAPPNSFLSSQVIPSSSYLQSPTVLKSFGSQVTRPSPLGASRRVRPSLQNMSMSPDESEDELATLYSLTDPSSDFGVITCPLQQQRPRLGDQNKPHLSVEFETLDPAEEVVYVSARDELTRGHSECDGSFFLVLTANVDLQTVTIWHAWYIDERSLAWLLKQRKAAKAATARRRSSFLNTIMGTGTTTPAVRRRDGPRESLPVAASILLPGEPATGYTAVASSRKPTRREEEENMASQMDPDYQPHASQQTARESRRISSLNADARGAQAGTNASFGGPGARRNASFGGLNERKSFGRRKSRASTPGTVFSRSLGPGEELMDIDNSMDSDGEESIDSTLRHIRATFEAAGADSIFGSPDGGFKRDLLVRNLHSFQMSLSASPTGSMESTIRIETLLDTQRSREADCKRLNVFVYERGSESVFSLQLLVTHRALWPEFITSPLVAVPFVLGETKAGRCTDIAKLRDHNVEALILDGQGLIMSLDNTRLIDLPEAAPYRVYDPIHSLILETTQDKEIGRNRTLPQPARVGIALTNIGAKGQFDEIDGSGIHHRRQMQLGPEDPSIEQLLKVCRLVLPIPQARIVFDLWLQAYAILTTQPHRLQSTAKDVEWVAFASTVLCFGIPLLDDKAVAALNVTLMASRKESAPAVFYYRKQQHLRELISKGLWCDTPSGTDRDRSPIRSPRPDQMASQKDKLLIIASGVADELARSATWNSLPDFRALLSHCATRLILGLHIFSEEQKLSTVSNTEHSTALAAVIAQLGCWLGASAWTYGAGQYYGFQGATEEQWMFVKPTTRRSPHYMSLMETPVSVFDWFESAVMSHSAEPYPTLQAVATIDEAMSQSKAFEEATSALTPRLNVLSNAFAPTSNFSVNPITAVEVMARFGITSHQMQTLPTAIAAPFREAIARCERDPPTTWPSNLLDLVDRDDLDIHAEHRLRATPTLHHPTFYRPRDIQTITHDLDQHIHYAQTKEESRQAISQLIFSEDRRLVEAMSLMHFSSPQVAECPKQPDWTDAQHYEQQKKLTGWVTVRMIALPAGEAMLHYDCQTPLLTDKYHLPGFSSSCLLQPMGVTMTADRSGLTEEKVNWAYFHAGTSAGLRVSRNVKGIDTSWIAFNKPNELTNRHAGLLLALGLSGHLRNVAKWLSFKYLTPKHSMTSVGLLLGLSASYMGTMDGLITRMLSVHITRMLPPGAAELNVSPVTQTAGLMGIGLLYYNTQHRRMSEVMLTEIEHLEIEDPDIGPDPLRDESYRLAAGFALGFINLGKGNDLRGLQGMHLPERLLAVAVGPRPVNAVHVFDKATAGAIIATTLVYMKTGDKVVARKIDIPDTEAQFDHVRPDMLMLRAMAKHLILWDDIEVNESSHTVPRWTQNNLPACYRSRFNEILTSNGRRPLKSSDVPFFNIASGLAWALSLKFAGSGNAFARDEILSVLDVFYLVKGGADAYYYDAKLTRATVRRCVDVLALSAATVMAGTGDLKTFRYLRRLHGRTDAETPYGSHLAAHLAIGVLFLGGGTYTFGTSNLALASLLCAFYPLFPTDVHDNEVHLQAFRHFWVFAAEARCLVVEDVDAQSPTSIPILVHLKNGFTQSLRAPCLLPDLDSIASVQTDDPSYWRVTLDFAANPSHLSAFKQNQRICVRRCPPSEAHNSTFSATLAALNETQSLKMSRQIWYSIFNLPVFKDVDRADIELILPPDAHSSTFTDDRGTVVDDKLVLKRAVSSSDGDSLRNLRALFAWAERARHEGDGKLRWLGHETVEVLKAKIEERARRIDGSG